MPPIPEDDRIGRQIADAAKAQNEAPRATEVAAIIVKAIFESDGNKMPAAMKYIAIQTIGGALETWKKQLFVHGDNELQKFKDAYRDTKMELDEIKLRLAIMQKEGKLG